MAALFSEPHHATAISRTLPSSRFTSSNLPASLIAPNFALSTSLTTAVQVPFLQLKNYGGQIFSRSSESGQGGGSSVSGILDGPLVANKERNTNNLWKRLGGDVAAASAAGGLVAPIVTIIDKGIIENASNRAKLSASVRNSLKTLLLRPHTFLTSKPFLLIFTLYGGTYLSANLLDTLTSTLRNRPASSVTIGSSKFFATSATNVSLCLYKDSHFTRMFGAAASASSPAKTVVPRVSYALFALRDSLTVFASFNVPPLIAPILPVSAGFEAYMSRASAAQFLAPAAVQILSTPLHLLGLDLYNRPDATTSMRVSRVVRDWAKSCVARMCRILPAFGVGGVVNTGVRRRWMEQLE